MSERLPLVLEVLALLEEDELVSVLAEAARLVHGDQVGPPRNEETTVSSSTLPPRLCLGCGTVGSDYYETRPSYCRACTLKSVGVAQQERNDASRAKAEQHRQPWTELEVEALLEGDAEGMSHSDLAELLGRTVQAVHNRLFRLRQDEAAGVPTRYAAFTITTTTTTTTTTVRRDPVCPHCFLVGRCFCD